MKVLTKKKIVTMLSVTLVLTSVLGCTSKKVESQPSPSAAASNNTGVKKKYDPPVTITTVWGVDPALKFKNNETIENSVANKWAAETLGINIKSLWSVTNTNSAFATKLRLALSSGQEMPDVVTVGDTKLAQDLINSGKFQEAGPLFDKYASDTWKKAMGIDPSVWNPYTLNGKKMGIPVLDYAYNHDYMLWIRQDWLDKLGMQGPKTINDLENIMDAFKTKNPGGLKPDEVIPLSIGFKDKINTWMSDPSWIFGAFGTIPQQWNKAADGKLEFGSIHSGIKPGLQKLKEWYDKGYIPKEAALWDENKTAEPAVAGKAGIMAGPYWMSGWPLQDTAKNVPTAVWKPYPIPTGADGKALRHGTNFTNGVTLINKNMKNPEALFTYQNYMFDNLADPQPGGPFDLGLFKGYDYDLDASGKPVYGDSIPGGTVNSVRYLLVQDGARIPDAQMKALLNLADGKEAKTRLEREVKNNYGKETPASAKVLMSQPNISLKNMYTGPVTDTMKSKLDYLNKIEMQTFNEIIYGKKGIEAFDEFVKTWKTSGGDQITKEVNDWYATINK